MGQRSQIQKAKTAAIILAAGTGKRMESDIQKQFLDLEGKPVLYYSLKVFEESPVDHIILVTGKDTKEYCKREIIDKYGFQKVAAITAGGKERYHSVYEGLKILEAFGTYTEGDYVLIHDGARPLISQDIIKRVTEAAKAYKAAVAGMPAKDTIKIADEEGFARVTPARSSIWTIQTPQAFSYPLIYHAYETLMEKEEYQIDITDDAMVVENMSACRVRLIEGSYENIKITTPEDMAIASAILQRRSQ